MSVTWSRRATNQLRAVTARLAQTHPAAAVALADRIVARSETLDGQPYLGAQVPEYQDPAVREVYEAPYRLLYRATEPDVLIVFVAHAAQQLPRTPPG